MLEAGEGRAHVEVAEVSRKRFLKCFDCGIYPARRMQSHGVDVHKTHVSRLEHTGTLQFTERLTSSRQSQQSEAESMVKHAVSGRDLQPLPHHRSPD